MRCKQIFSFIFLVFIVTQSFAQQNFPIVDSVLVFDIHQLTINKDNYKITKKHFNKHLFTTELTQVKVIDSSAVHWGFINQQGVFAIPPVYDSVVSIFENGRILLGRYFNEIEPNRLFIGIVNELKEPIVPISFVEIGAIANGFIPAKNRHNLWAIYDTTGRLVHEPEYDSVLHTQKGSIWVRKHGKWGALNSMGKYMIQPKYKYVQADTGGSSFVTKFPEFSYMNSKSEPILSFECDSVVNFSKGIYLYFQNERCGLRSVKEDSKAVYTFIGKPINQRAVACKNEKCGLLNMQGKIILPLVYDSVMIDHSEFIRLKKNGLWGLVDRIYFPKIPHQYKYLKNFTNGMAAAQSAQSLWGYVNIVGDTVVPFIYQSAEDFSMGLAVVKAGDSTYVINKKGEMVVSPEDMPRFIAGAGRVDNNLPVKYTFPINCYDRYTKLVDGITLVHCGKQYGLLGKRGNELFPAICDTVVYDPTLQIATFHCDTMAGVVDRYDNFVHPLLYNFDTIYSYHQGCALAKKRGYFGGIDIMKNIRIAPQYERMQDFHDGKWGITLNGKWDFTDLNENILVQPNYEAIQPFNGGAGGIKYKGRWNLISAQDKEMNVTTYDSISPTPHGSWVLYLDGKQGLTDTTGEEMIVCRYEKIMDLGKGLVQVWKNGKTGVMNRFQNIVIPISYDHLEFDSLNDLFLLTNKGTRARVRF